MAKGLYRIMSNAYQVEYTDTYGGDANYSWVNRKIITMPELTHYGYGGGTNYCKANKVYQRELMKRAKAAMGLTGAKGRVENYGETIAFYPYRSCTVMFISWHDE